MNIKFIKNKSKNTSRRREYLNTGKNIKNISLVLLCVIFMVGVIIGTFYFKNAADNNFFEDNPNILKNVELNSIERAKIFSESMYRNIIMLLFMWVIGLSILGIPVLIFYILYDGFSLGLSVSYILYSFGLYKGYSFIHFNMYITTLINTAATILLCNSALKVTINILRQKTNIKSEFMRHSTVCIIMLILLVFSSMIEICIFDFLKSN